MSKQEEATRSSALLCELQQIGWFRKISDRVQVGLPDIMGCYKSRLVGIEVKAVKMIVENTKVPTKAEHRFTRKQVEELKSVDRNRGIALGVIFCGPQFAVIYPHEIDENGQVESSIILHRLVNRLDWRTFLESL